MNYRLIIHPQFDKELREQALYYQDQFSTGINDFIDALEDTYEKILPFPFSYAMVEELQDDTVRGIPLKANPKRKNYAKNFPFKLIYKIYKEKGEIVIYQLWAEASIDQIKRLE